MKRKFDKSCSTVAFSIKREATWPPYMDDIFNLPAILECLESRAHLLDYSPSFSFRVWEGIDQDTLIPILWATATSVVKSFPP